MEPTIPPHDFSSTEAFRSVIRPYLERNPGRTPSYQYRHGLPERYASWTSVCSKGENCDCYFHLKDNGINIQVLSVNDALTSGWPVLLRSHGPYIITS